MEYFEGVHGYERAGIQIIPVRNITEITERNLTQWMHKFNQSTPKEYVTRKFWNQIAFDLSKTI